MNAESHHFFSKIKKKTLNPKTFHTTELTHIHHNHHFSITDPSTTHSISKFRLTETQSSLTHTCIYLVTYTHDYSTCSAVFIFFLSRKPLGYMYPGKEQGWVEKAKSLPDCSRGYWIIKRARTVYRKLRLRLGLDTKDHGFG